MGVPDQRLVAEQQQHYSMEWEVPSSLPTGEYEVRLGMFSNGRTTVRGWKNASTKGCYQS